METGYRHIGIALMKNNWSWDFKKIVLFMHNTYIFSPYNSKGRGRLRVSVFKYNQELTQYNFDKEKLNYLWFIGIKIRK